MRTTMRAAPASTKAFAALIASLAAALGAALAYLFDPDRGKARRHRLADRTAHGMRRQTRHAVARSRYARGRLRGAVLRRRGAGEHTPIDDVDVKQQVHQALRRTGLMTSDVSIEVSKRTAVLRGQAKDGDEIAQIEQVVATVPGVERVENFLHRPGEPAPNKLSVLRLNRSA